MRSNLPDSDADLIAQLKTGDFDLQVWEGFVKRVRGWVCRNFPELTNEADDIATLAAEYAYESLEAFRGECRFIRWVNRIAYNIACRRLQKTRQHVVVSFEDLHHAAAEGDDIDFALQQIEAAEAMKSLTEQERAVCLLRLLHDVDHKDIAAQLGISPNASRQTWMRAAEKLGRYRREHGW